MKNLIEDLKRTAKGGFLMYIYTWLFDVNFKAVIHYRLSHWLYYKFNLQVLPRLINIRCRRKYSIDIDYGADIGPGFVIKHGIGVVIGRWVKAGKNLTVYQGVTIGGNSGKTRKYNEQEICQPILGDNVKVYTGAIILGPVLIEHDSEIGANTVITSDVSNNIIVFTKREIRCKAK